MGRLDSKVVVVTGAAQGQGACEAELLAHEGAEVILCDVADEIGGTVVDGLRRDGLSATYRHLDVTSEEQWVELAAGIRRSQGRLDGLVNNAGIGSSSGVVDQDRARWDRVMSINLTGPLLGMKHMAPLMAESGGGSIVNISSIAGMSGYPAAAYSASKWGLRGLTKSAALELADRGVRVNSVHPGYIKTATVQGFAPAFLSAFERVAPMERGAESSEVAPLVLYLLSDESSFMTGSELVIDGGLTAAGAMHVFGKLAGGSL